MVDDITVGAINKWAGRVVKLVAEAYETLVKQLVEACDL